MSYICDRVLQDGLLCHGTVLETDNFCRLCAKPVDKNKFTVPVIADTPEVEEGSDTVDRSDSMNVASGNVSTDDQLDNGTDEILECLQSCPGRNEQEMRDFEDAVRNGVSKAKEYLDKMNNKWRMVTLHIGVTGVTGAGKSSFVNALRGVRHGHKSFAEVGVKETTTEIKAYPYPGNTNILLWDMPGIGSSSFTKQTFIEKVRFDDYDFFLILTHKRFSEYDIWLAKEVKKIGKSCFFVRTHIHSDIKNDKGDHPTTHSTDAMMESVRSDILKHIKDEGIEAIDVFLIDNKKTDKYDFDRLTAALISGIPDKNKREAFVLSLKVLTKSVIDEKKKDLESSIWRIAAASAFYSAAPIQSSVIDDVLIFSEVDEWRKQFGLTEEAVKKFIPGSSEYYSNIDGISTTLAKFGVAVIAFNAVENKIIGAIPLLAMGAKHFAQTVITLKRILNIMANDALTLYTEMLKNM